jgi:hypothetical protein
LPNLENTASHKDRLSAAFVGRSCDATCHQQVHAVGAARCTVVSQQHRVHPAH